MISPLVLPGILLGRSCISLNLPSQEGSVCIPRLSASTQNFNRYSYCLNNPLKYTDERKWSDSYTSFCPLENRRFRIRLESFEEWIPRKSNYIPFFIFDFSTMENAGANTIAFYNKDEYIVRYDLTISDIYFLLNSDGALELHFPPDERMKDIHMYPPYEEVIAKYSN